MNIDAAKNILAHAVKSECRDHAFGDCEVYWEIDGKEVAAGYFGGGSRSVSVFNDTDDSGHFEGAEADELRKIFAKEEIGRNDETGPDEFVLGKTMPGLTLEGVRRELEGA